MKFPWERLAEQLRTELGELGGLIRLLELNHGQEQHTDAFSQAQIEAALDSQAAALRACRIRREKILRAYFPAGGLSRRTVLPEKILEEVAPEARPLIQALSEEIGRLDEQFHWLARGLPAAAQRKLDHILKSPGRPPTAPMPKQRAEGSCLPVNGGY